MNTNIPLTKPQKEIMQEFYTINPTKVVFNKNERNAIWKIATKREIIPAHYDLLNTCPALSMEIEQSYSSGNNIQSAVFSECVYAQTLANMFELTVFHNCRLSINHIPKQVIALLDSYALFPRYSYSSNCGRKMLVQAGGHNGIDSALITVVDLNIYTIEFKEPGAKTSEPDLPKYGENGELVLNTNFAKRYPQFLPMLQQHLGVSMFDQMGSNINDFTVENINYAVTNNYISSNKYAHVCCTEDKHGLLVMMPINQIHLWATIQGEIRPSGRNHYNVWTPNILREFIHGLGGIITDDNVSIPVESLALRRERGGNRKISGYKITPLFFVYAKHTELVDGILTFKFNSIRQLNPTISAKVFFRDLSYSKVKEYYNNIQG